MHSCGIPILLELGVVAVIKFTVYNRYSFHTIKTAKNNIFQNNNIKKTNICVGLKPKTNVTDAVDIKI